MIQKEKKGILIVSFGTSIEETRKKTIDTFEAIVKKAYPDWEVRRAFTSEMIIKILKKRDGICIDTIQEALDRFREEGFTHLLIQPTHIINGVENNRMLHLLRRNRDSFVSMRIGAPLLTSPEDMEEVIAGIMEDYRALPSDTGVLCLGHGTDHYSNFTYPAFEYTARRMGYSRLFIGTVEGYPDIETVISHVLQSGCKKMILLPLLFVAGDHARNDMAGEEPDSWKSRLNASGIQTTCVLKGLGEYPAIQHLFLKHMERA